MTAKITAICPQLPVTDVAASVAWYQRALGFRSTYQDATVALLHRDSVELHLWRCDNPAIAKVSSAYLRSADVDALHKGMLGASEGGRIVAPRERDWGMREFYVWDPDGNLLKFGQPVASAP